MRKPDDQGGGRAGTNPAAAVAPVESPARGHLSLSQFFTERYARRHLRRPKLNQAMCQGRRRGANRCNVRRKRKMQRETRQRSFGRELSTAIAKCA
jgi:hypothetical protein